MRLIISAETRFKLKTKHKVSKEEIIQCFENLIGNPVLDTREEHKTESQTQWFISETDKRRKLKVVFIQIAATAVVIKTAYSPNLSEEKIYRQKLKKLRKTNPWLI